MNSRAIFPIMCVLIILSLLGRSAGASDYAETFLYRVSTYCGNGWPVAGCTLAPASTFQIMVQALDEPVDVQGEYSLDSGSTWVAFDQVSVDADGGDHGFLRWLVPEIRTNTCAVRLTDMGRPDIQVYLEGISVEPDLAEGITIHSPAQGEIITAGLSYFLDYEPIHARVGDSSNWRSLLLEMSLDGGATWEANNSHNLGLATYPYCRWYVPDIETDQCYLRMTSTLFPSISGTVGPITIKRDCPCVESFARFTLTGRSGQGLSEYYQSIPMLLLTVDVRSWAEFTVSGDLPPLERYQSSAEFDPGEYVLDPVELFGWQIGLTSERVEFYIRATCRVGTPSCRGTVREPELGSSASWTGNWSGTPHTQVYIYPASGQRTGGVTASTKFDFSLLREQPAESIDMDTIRYYWGPGTEDFDVMLASSVAEDLSWDGGEFLASINGDWLFAVWDEKQGRRIGDIARYEITVVDPEAQDIGDVSSPTHDRGAASENPLVSIEFTPEENYGSSGIASLRYYWGLDPDDDDLIEILGKTIPLTWRAGDFEATKEASWIFVLWGADIAGERVTDWMQFDFLYENEQSEEISTGLATDDGYISSRTHVNWAVTDDPDLQVDFNLWGDFDSSATTKLRCFWGFDPDNDTKMFDEAFYIPLSTTTEQFTATEDGDWMFICWGENDGGERVTDWLGFHIRYYATGNPLPRIGELTSDLKVNEYGDQVVAIDFSPSDEFHSGDIETLQYYWGNQLDQDERAEMELHSQSLPLAWRAGDFEISEGGSWRFTLWGVNAEGNRATDWLDVDYHDVSMITECEFNAAIEMASSQLGQMGDQWSDAPPIQIQLSDCADVTVTAELRAWDTECVVPIFAGRLCEGTHSVGWEALPSAYILAQSGDVPITLVASNTEGCVLERVVNATIAEGIDSALIDAMEDARPSGMGTRININDSGSLEVDRSRDYYMAHGTWNVEWNCTSSDSSCEFGFEVWLDDQRLPSSTRSETIRMAGVPVGSMCIDLVQIPVASLSPGEHELRGVRSSGREQIVTLIVAP